MLAKMIAKMIATLLGLLGLQTLAPEVVDRQLGDEAVCIIDNRPASVWAQAHVPGAKHLDPGEYTKGDLPEDKDMPLVFYCAGPLCPMAPGAALRARKMGYTNVSVMSDGISGWLKQDRPVERG